MYLTFNNQTKYKTNFECVIRQLDENQYSVVNALGNVIWCFPLSCTWKIDEKGACHLVAGKGEEKKFTQLSQKAETDVSYNIIDSFFFFGKLQPHTARFILKYTSK